LLQAFLINYYEGLKEIEILPKKRQKWGGDAKNGGADCRRVADVI